MNEIRVKRMLIAGLVMFLVWILAEIVLEQGIGRLLFGDLIDERWLQTSTSLGEWTAFNHLMNLLVALVNCTALIWLYASLRPMYGVGIKTALITSALGIILGSSLTINVVNLGLLPLRFGLLEGIFEAIEFPIAMLAGAAVYEGAGDRRVF